MQEGFSVQLNSVGQNEDKVNGKVLTIFPANKLFFIIQKKFAPS